MSSIALRVRVVASALCAALLSAACAAPVPEITPEHSIADALGIDDLIVLRVEADPLDAEESLPWHGAQGENVLLASNGAGSVGDASDRPHLALRDALRASLAASSELQVALANVAVARAAAEGERVVANPLLDVLVRWPTGSGRSVVEVAPSLGLAAFLERPRRASAADARLHASVERAVGTALDVAAELVERYADVQALDELSTRLAERRALVGKLVDVAR